ncbi:protease modulator HflC [Vibrio astriarenae]
MLKNKWVIGGLLFAAYLLTTVFIFVEETDYVIVSQFGRPVKVINDAGLNIKLPVPIQNVTIVDKRIKVTNLDTSEYGTKDRRNIVVDAFVIWKVVEPQTFVSTVRNFETAQLRLQALTNSHIGSEISAVEIDSVFSQSMKDNEIERVFDTVTRRVNKQTLSEFGVMVVEVSPNRFSFPTQNLQAIYTRMESEWDRLAKQYRAEGEEQAAIIRAETQVEVSRIKSEAYMNSQYIKGEAESEAAKVYSAAFDKNPEYYQFVRSMEAYEDMFDEQTQLILSSDSPLFNRLMTPPLESK